MQSRLVLQPFQVLAFCLLCPDGQENQHAAKVLRCLRERAYELSLICVCCCSLVNRTHLRLKQQAEYTMFAHRFELVRATLALLPLIQAFSFAGARL